jgi:hypothetical protein
VAQTFSWSDVPVDLFQLERDPLDRHRVIITIHFRALERTGDLIGRKLARLIDVLVLWINDRRLVPDELQREATP